MPHLDFFSENRKPEKQKKKEKQKKRNKKQVSREEKTRCRERKHARERKRRTHGQEIEGTAKKEQTQRERSSANHPEKSVPQFGTILREEIYRTLENKSRMLPILGQTFQNVLKLKVEISHN